MKAEDYHKLESERELLQKVVDLALLTGWMVHHVLDTFPHAKIMGQPGFQDFIIIKDRLLIAAELKRESGKFNNPHQNEWHEAFKRVTEVKVFKWKPSSWPEIEALLKGAKP